MDDAVDALSALGSRAASNAASCRARASQLRADLEALYADFVGRCSAPPVAEGFGVGDVPESGLDPTSAADALDIQLAQCEEDDALAGLEAAEEHLKTGHPNRALAGYLAFLQATLVVGMPRDEAGGPSPPHTPSSSIGGGGSMSEWGAASSVGGGSSGSNALMAEPRRPGSIPPLGRSKSAGLHIQRTPSHNANAASPGAADLMRPMTPMALGTVTHPSGERGVSPLRVAAPPGELPPGGRQPRDSPASPSSSYGGDLPGLSRSRSQILSPVSDFHGGGGSTNGNGGEWAGFTTPERISASFSPPPALSRSRTQSGRSIRRRASTNSARSSSAGGSARLSVYGPDGAQVAAPDVEHGDGTAGGCVLARAERCRRRLLGYFHVDLVRTLDRFAATPAGGMSREGAEDGSFAPSNLSPGGSFGGSSDLSTAAIEAEAVSVRHPHENQQAILAAGALLWLSEAWSAEGRSSDANVNGSASAADHEDGGSAAAPAPRWAALEAVLCRYTQRPGRGATVSKAERDATAAVAVVAVRKSASKNNSSSDKNHGALKKDAAGKKTPPPATSRAASVLDPVWSFPDDRAAPEVEAARASLRALSATATWQLRLLATLPEHPPGDVLGRLYGGAAGNVIGDALDVVMARMGTEADAAGGSLPGGEAAAAAVRSVGQLCRAAEVFVGVALPMAAKAAARAHAWRPTLATAASPALHARAAIEAALGTRRRRFAEELGRRAMPAAHALVSTGGGGWRDAAGAMAAGTSLVPLGAELGASCAVHHPGENDPPGSASGASRPATLVRRHVAPRGNGGGHVSPRDGNPTSAGSHPGVGATRRVSVSVPFAAGEARCAAALREAARVLPAAASLPASGERTAVIRSALLPVGEAVADAVASALEGVSASKESAETLRLGFGGHRVSTRPSGLRVDARALRRLRPPRMTFSAAAAARNTALTAAALMSAVEAAALTGCAAFVRPVVHSDERRRRDTGVFTAETVGADEGETLRSAAAAAAEVGVRLERLAGAAEGRAIQAAAAAASTALEGAAAQPWGFHRKPEAMAGEPAGSPHIASWRRALARGLGDVLEGFAAVGGLGPPGGRFRVGGPFQALVDAAAAEAAGMYLRLTPSRAWRDRFAADVRAVVGALRAAEGFAEKERGSANLSENAPTEKSSAAARVARALATRAALLTCGVDALLAKLPITGEGEGGGERPPPPRITDEDDAPPAPSLGHPWGPGPSPEALWASTNEREPSGAGAWAWCPEDDVFVFHGARDDGDGGRSSERTRGGAFAFSFERTEKTSEAASRWEAAEAALVEAASAGEAVAALWRRSEMALDDVTPLDEREAAGREALRETVARHAGSITDEREPESGESARTDRRKGQHISK